MGKWGDGGSAPSASLGSAAAAGKPADLERLLGLATCAFAVPTREHPRGDFTPRCAQHRVPVVLSEGSPGTPPFLFTYPPPTKASKKFCSSVDRYL